MEDKWKNFIDEHHEEFDDLHPKKKSWTNIEYRIGHRAGKRFVINKLALTASIIGIISLSIFLFLKKESRPTATNFQGIPKEYIRQIDEFQEIIKVKHLELSKINATEPALYKQFDSDLQNLNASYKQLFNKLEDTSNAILVIQALEENLRLQIQLLNRQLEIFNKRKTGNERAI